MSRLIPMCLFILFLMIRIDVTDSNLSMEIHFLDIGQGDAIHIRTPEGIDIVIDAGRDRSIVYELEETIPSTDKTIEYLIATHSDADHIGGISEVEEYWEIGTFLHSGVKEESEWTAAIESLEIQGTIIRAGDNIQINDETSLSIIWPTGESQKEINDSSIVVLFEYKESRILFTGDISTKIEKEIMEDIGDIDILKVGHHGSKYSTGKDFLDTLKPKIAVISVGINNTYGHPHESILERLESRGIEILRTDQQGRITCTFVDESLICR